MDVGSACVNDWCAQIRLLELKHLCVETDSPALPATKGEVNEPAELVTSVRVICDVKGLPAEVVAASTTAVAADLFRPPSSGTAAQSGAKASPTTGK